MEIKFLWWDGCPSYPEAWNRLQQALRELEVDARTERIEIRTEEDAMRWRFPGSPTILVEGKDIDPQAQTAYRLTCRLYFTEDGRPSPVPTAEAIKRAILGARNAGL